MSVACSRTQGSQAAWFPVQWKPLAQAEGMNHITPIFHLTRTEPTVKYTNLSFPRKCNHSCYSGIMFRLWVIQVFSQLPGHCTASNSWTREGRGSSNQSISLHVAVHSKYPVGAGLKQPVGLTWPVDFVMGDNPAFFVIDSWGLVGGNPMKLLGSVRDLKTSSSHNSD